MRITSGIYGGRTLATPKTGEIRPTQDRVREALFSMLGDCITGARFLDLFAGSGAVGLEALSRGAALAVFVERNPKHIECIRKNIAALAPSPMPQLVRADVYRWIAAYRAEAFDIAFADPPYALGQERGYTDFLGALAANGVIRVGGVFAAETTSEQSPETPPGWELVRDRTYGKSRLAIWRRIDG